MGFQEKIMNYITLQATEFIDSPQGSVTFGFRMYDWEGKVYDNTWERIPDDDLDILRKVCEESADDEVVMAMFEYIWENETGIYIGDIWYDWEDIKDILEDVMDITCK